MSVPQELVLPRLAESLTEARVVVWLVEEGDEVSPGQPVVEVDADKFMVGLEVEHRCVVERILCPEGETVQVGAPLARLAPVSAPRAETPKPAAPARPPVRAVARVLDDEVHGFQLEPLTAPGRRFCARVEEHAVDAAARAPESDREGRFGLELFREMQESGLAAACVPERFGGGGLESLHDLTVGISRMGRADASVAITLNMHLASVWGMARHWRAAVQRGDARGAASLERLLQQIGEGRLLQCVVGSEPGTDILHPLTEARRDEGGWRITGRKIFGTLSEAADLIHLTVRVREGGTDRIAMASVPRGTPGLRVLGDWDALGMRGSASHGVEVDDCFVTDAMLQPHGEWGEWNPLVLEAQVSGNIGLLGAYLGVAEAARALVLPALRTRRKAPSNRPLAERPGIQHGVAEMEIGLAAARASLGRIGMLADECLLRPHPDGGHALLREFQCAKWFVNRTCIEVVDRAMTLSGGSGYAAASPLARLYRDVRAGPFMQLFSPNEAFEYIGRVTLGLDPEVG